ncbi:MAG: alpha/beta fold hydrolase [Patescibacteria group bacterium]|jgi:pimeloyl-ACP methyl ester carboxylesterase
MEKLSFINRRGQKIVVNVRQAKDQAGLVFVMHGFGGFKDQDQIQAIGESFFEKNYTTVLFDTANTLGESEGRVEDGSLTSYYQDLEDVIAWSETRDWYQEPFILAGHSMGSFCIAYYAENYPEKVLAIAPFSPVISGKFLDEAMIRRNPAVWEKWRQTGWLEVPSNSKPGAFRRSPWSVVADWDQYDLIPQANKLNMPVLIIVGQNDTSTPVYQVEKFFQALPGIKEMHVIDGAEHTFRTVEHFAEIKKIIFFWLDKMEKWR